VSGRRAAEPPPESDATLASERAADVTPEPAARDDASAGPDAASRAAHEAAAEPESEPGAGAGGPHVIDVIRDELGLARAQIDAGLILLAEGTVRRRLAHLEADGVTADDETDALRLILAETLWREGRPTAARRAFEAIRPSSPQRRLPMAMLVEAETLSAAGETDRATGAQERLLAAVGAEAALALATGAARRLTWPVPESMRPRASHVPRPPWTARPDEPDAEVPVDDERVAAGRGRLEEARVAYVAGDLERGDAEMSIAVRLDPALAADGVSLIEPTLGGQPPGERLLLYGDLLNAAGREAEAARTYDLAAERRGRATST
jgi:hypothetical protein